MKKQYTTYQFKATLRRGSRIRIATGTVIERTGKELTLDDSMLSVFEVLKEECNQGFESISLTIKPKSSSAKSV